MKFLSLIPLLLATIIAVTGCKKDAIVELPPYTHTGSNVLAFKIGNQVYQTQGAKDTGAGFMDANHFVTCSLSADSTSGNIHAMGTFNDQYFSLYVAFRQPLPSGRFLINTSHNTGSSFAEFNSYPIAQGVGSGTLYNSDSTHQGYINLTYVSDSVIAGTFELQLVDGQGRIIHLSEGRFDVKR